MMATTVVKQLVWVLCMVVAVISVDDQVERVVNEGRTLQATDTLVAFNNFLNGQTWGSRDGSIPGICTTFDECTFMISETPRYIQSIWLRLSARIPFLLWHITANGDNYLGPENYQGTEDGWVIGGGTHAKDTVLENINIGSFKVSAGSQSPTQQDLSFEILDLVFFLNTAFQFLNFKASLEGFSGFVQAVASLDNDCSGNSCDFGTSDIRSMQVDRNVLQNANGANLLASMRLKPKEGKTLDNDLPYQVEFVDTPVGAGSEKCVFSMPAANAIRFPDGTGFRVLSIDLSTIFRWMAQGLVSGGICSGIEQLATTRDGQPGALNVLLDDFYTSVHQYLVPLLDIDDQVDENSTNWVAQNPDLANVGLDFTTDENFLFVSDGFNQILGRPSTTPGLEGVMVLNEVVNRLLENDVGLIEISDPTNPFGDVELDSDFFVLETDLSAMIVSFKLERYSIAGLNTFIENFSFFQKVPGFPFTLKHAATLRSIDLRTTISVKITEGIWVANKRNRELNLDFEIRALLENIQLETFTISAFDFSRIENKYVGHFLDTEPNAYQDALDCALLAIPKSTIASFRASGVATAFTARSTSGVLDNTITAIFDILSRSVRGLISDKDNAWSLSEVLLAPEMVNLLEEYLDNLDPACWVFVPTNVPVIVDLETNSIASAVNTALNRVVGGNPVEPNGADINSIIDQYMKLYQQSLGEMLGDGIFLGYEGDANDVNGKWSVYTGDVNDPNPELTRYQRRSENIENQGFVALSNVVASNLHSVNRLEFQAVGPRDIFVSAGIGRRTDGVVWPAPPLSQRGFVTLEFTLTSKVCRNNDCANSEVMVDDTVDILLNFNFDLEATVLASVDQSRVNSLFLKDLDKPICALATMADYEIKNIQLNTTQFFSSVKPGGNSFSDSVMGRALEELSFELSNTNELHRISTNQVRYLAQRLALKGKDFVKNLRIDNDFIELSTCGDYELVIRPSIFDGFEIPEFNNQEWFEDQPLIQYWPYEGPGNQTQKVFPATIWESRVNTDGKNIFQTQGNVLVELLRDFFRTEGAGAPLKVLSNTSFFGQYIVARDDEIDLRLNLTEFPNLIPSLVDDSLIEGAMIQLGMLKVDSIQNAFFQLFKQYGDALYTTSHQIGFTDDLKASIEVIIETNGAFVGDSPDTISREIFSIDFFIKGFVLDIVTFLAMDVDVLQSLQINTFLQVNENQEFLLRPDAFPCFLMAALDDGVGVPGFQVTYEDITNVTMVPLNGAEEASKLFSDSAVKVVGALINTIAELFKDEVKDVTQGPIRRSMDEYLKETLADVKDGTICPFASDEDIPLTGDDLFYDFVNSKQILEFYKFVEDNFLNPESGWNLNVLIAAGLVGVFDDIGFTLTDFPLSYNQETIGSVSLNIQNIEIQNLDTVDLIQILDYRPVLGQFPGEYENFTTQSRIGTGAGDKNVTVRMEVNIIADGIFEDREGLLPVPDTGNMERVQNNLLLQFSFSYIELATTLITKLDISKLMKIRVASFLNIGEYPCLLEAFEENGLQILEFNFGLGDIRARMSCIDKCNSPDLAGLEDGTGAENQELNNLLTEGVNNTIKLLNVYIQSDSFAEAIRQELDVSEINCISLTDPFDVIDSPEQPVAQYMGIAALSAIFAGVVGFAFLVPLHIKRRDEVMKSALLRNASKGKSQMATDFVLQERKLRSPSRHPAVPTLWKVLLPLWVLVNIVFFISSNFFSNGAVVETKLKLLGDTSRSVAIMEFTLESSINDMWNSGSFLLALFIAILSGFWPYVKCILLLFCWYTPSTIIGNQGRSTTLEILDTLGKWSLIDVFVLVLLIVGFRFFVTSSYLELDNILEADALAFDVVVVPGWGIYGFVFGVMGNLFVNHLMIYWTSRLVESDLNMQGKIDGTFVPETPSNKVAIHRHRFSAPDAAGKIYGFGPATKLTIGALLVLSFFCVLIGAIVPLITFTFLGIGGALISFLNPESGSATHSLASVAVAIVNGAGDDVVTRVGILFLQIIYLLFAVIVPLMLILIFGYLWFVPLRIASQRKMLFFAKILSAWESLAVFVLSVIACVLEIGRLAEFIVENSTGSICTNVENALLLRDVGLSDSKCFSVEASFEASGFILLAGCGMLIVVSFLSFRIIGAAVEDRRAFNVQQPCVCPAGPGKSVRQRILRMMTTPVARVRVTQAVPRYSDSSDESRMQMQNPMFSNIDV